MFVFVSMGVVVKRWLDEYIFPTVPIHLKCFNLQKSMSLAMKIIDLKWQSNGCRFLLFSAHNTILCRRMWKAANKAEREKQQTRLTQINCQDVHSSKKWKKHTHKQLYSLNNGECTSNGFEIAYDIRTQQNDVQTFSSFQASSMAFSV